MPQPIPATPISGDGIGPEITEATLAALQALGAPFQWERQVAGLEGVTRLRSAIDRTVNQNQVRAGDLGGTAKTADFTRAPVKRISNG